MPVLTPTVVLSLMLLLELTPEFSPTVLVKLVPAVSVLDEPLVFVWFIPAATDWFIPSL